MRRRSGWTSFRRKSCGRTRVEESRARTVAGLARSSTEIVASLVDTNILVYRCDSRDPAKRTVARETLRTGLAESQLGRPHQALVEYAHALTLGRRRMGAVR